MEGISLKEINQIILFIWLGILSIEDIKHKKITLQLIILGGILLFTISIVLGELSIWNRMGGVVIGGIVILISYITRGQIGIGDGIILATIGLSFGFFININLLIYALFLSAILSIILLTFKKAKKKSTIPFIPFLLVGYLGVLIL